MMVQRSFIMSTNNGPIHVKRIDKREARKRFYEGEDIYLKLCKINPTSEWVDDVITNKRALRGFFFDSLVNTFEYYNCNNKTGTYASFYVADN